VSADHTSPARPGDSRAAAGITAVVVAVSVWGTSSVLIKQVPELDAAAVATYRLWIGAASVTAIFLARGGRLSMGLLRRSLWGGVAFWADIVLFFSALQRTSVANATVIGALQPLLLLLVAGRMFGEPARWSQAAWGALAIGGAAVVVLGGDSGGASGGGGDALAVGALLAWTAYFIASKRAREVLSSLEYLAGLSIVAAVLAVPTPAILGIGMEMPSAKGWAIITTIAMVNGALGHFLMNWAHAHVPLVITSLLTLAVPVVAAAMAAVVLDEPLVALQVAGMAVVVGALAVVAVEGARRQPQAFADEQAALAAAPEP
jgi:drug/metabolite transporter (DMT)-like permease